MKGNTLVQRSFATIALLILLVSLLPIIPLSVTPAEAQTSYLTVSQTYLGTNNTIKVEVVDPDIAAGEWPTVVITWDGQERIINMSKTVLGHFVAFIANVTANTTWTGDQCSGGDVYADWVICNSSVPASPPTIVASQGNVSGSNYKDCWPVVQFFNISAGVDPVITYADRPGEEITLSHGETNIAITAVDRETPPPNATIYLTVSDPTENIDPTAVEDYTQTTWINYTAHFYLNGQDITDKVKTYYPKLNGSETDKNTGSFTIAVNLTDVQDGYGEKFGQNDVLEILLKDDDDLTVTASQEFIITVTDGTIHLQSDEIAYSSKDFTIWVLDEDRNLDTEAVDYINGTSMNVTVKIYNSTGDLLKTYHLAGLEETDENTGNFTGTILVNMTSASDVNADGNNTDTLKVVVPPDLADGLYFELTYNDPFNITGGLSEAYLSLVVTPATIEFEKSAYPLSEADSVKIRLTEPDANDDPDRIDMLKINATAPTDKSPEVNYTTAGLMVQIGNLYLKVDDTYQSLTSWDLTMLRETGKNTGVFEFTVNLTAFDVEVGDTVTIIYYDKFNDVNATATATIGGTVGVLSLDRTTVPIAVGEEVVVYITLEDADWNANPYIKEFAQVNITAYNATNEQVGFKHGDSWHFNNLTLPLKETGVNTGVFTGSFTYTVSEDSVTVTIDGNTYTLNNTDTQGTTIGTGVKGKEMVNGKFTVVYEEPLVEDDAITKSATLKTHTAQLSVNATQVSLGDAILVTLTEPDMDLDSESADTVTVTYSTDSTYPTVTFEETGVSTGVFTAEFVVGTDISVNPGDTITFNYTDTATAASYYGTELVEDTIEVEVSVISNPVRPRPHSRGHGNTGLG